MNFRLTAILFGAILVLGVVLLILTLGGDGDKPSTDALMEELAGVKPEDIDTVEMEREDGAKLTLKRVGKDRWDVEWDAINSAGQRQPVKAKADPGGMTDLIGTLLKAKPTTHPELSSNPALHGLQPPGLKVTLKQGGERSSTINIGDVTSGAKAVAFVTTSSRPSRPMVTSRSFIEPLLRNPGRGKAVDLAKWGSDFRIRTVFGDTTTTDQVSSVTLAAKGKTLGLTRSGSGWSFTSPAGWGPADPVGDTRNPTPGTFTGVAQLIGTLTNLQAQTAADFVETPTPQQLTDYGLNPGNPDAVRVELKNRDDETIVAFIGKKDAGAPPGPGVPAVPTGKVWVRVEGQPGVIRATGRDLEGLVAVIENPDPLRDRTLLALDPRRIDGIDTSRGVKLRKVGPVGDWKLYGPPTPNEPQATNGQVVRRLLEALLERRTIKSFPAPNDANFAPGVTQVEVKVWSDAFDPPAKPNEEPKPKAKVEPTTLIFGKAEGDSVYVRRVLPDGTKADFLLPDKIKIGVGDLVGVVETVAKNRLDLLDTSLKTFSPDVVSKVTVSGAANYDLDKDEKPDPSTGRERWTFAGPADRKGQTADRETVAEMLRILGTQQSVTRFVNEAPDEPALIDYGFVAPKPPPAGAPPAPRLKVVLALKGTDPADQKREYEFGKETADGNSVYARQIGKAAVFTVPKLVYTRFADADLRDRAIFRFDVAQVTAVELKGWGKGGFVVDLHFDKNKDGVWVIKSPPTPAGYSLDPNKVTAFLNTLGKTAVKSFLPGPELPEHGFKNDKEYLMITVKRSAGPDIKLILGAPTPDGQGYYGTSSLLPPVAPVFTVDAAPFKMYKESSGAFAR